MFTKTRYSACCSSSLCLKPCHASSALGSPWEDLCTSDLVFIAESFEECVRRLLTWKEAMEENGQSKCRREKDHDLWYGSGPPAVFRRVSCAVCRTGVGRNRIFCNGFKHWVHKKCSGMKCLAKDPDYSVHSARELHASWTADHIGKSKLDLTSRW